MQNYVVYYASSPDEIYECCYSLLKYLDVYNLKPPADHAVIVYSNQPALLEAYGSYFNHFELKEINPAINKETGKIRKDVNEIFNDYKGNIIYLPTNTYPVKEFDSIFAAINRGAVYKGSIKQLSPQSESFTTQLPVIAFNNTNQDIDSILLTSGTHNISEFVQQYEDLKEFRQLLKDFFRKYQEESVPNQVKLMHSIDAAEIQEQKNKFKKLPLYQRLLRKVMGKGWDISKHAKR